METILSVIGYGIYVVVLLLAVFFCWLAYQSFMGKNQIIDKLTKEKATLEDEVNEFKAIRDALVNELKDKEDRAETTSKLISKDRAGLAVRLAPKPKTVEKKETVEV